MTRLEQFNRCIKGPFVTSGLDVQWRYRDGVLAFQCTKSKSDWYFNFFAVPMDDDGDKVHAGFLALWKSVEDHIALTVGTDTPVIEGFSQGAAIATLAHRYFRRKGKFPKTTVFGCPKVFASSIHLPDLDNIQMNGDIVCWARSSDDFRDVGQVAKFGPKSIPLPWKHLPSYYRKYI